MKLKDIPYNNRPWTRIKTEGAKSLNDAELLAVIFGRGNKKDNAIDLSNKLLSNYNLSKLSDTSFTELFSIVNDEVKAYQIMAICELNLRYSKLKSGSYKKTILCAKDVFSMFKDEFLGKKKEYLYVVLLDAKNNVISKQMVSVGTLTSSLIHPREVFNLAIRECANSIIVVHNHPSGDVTPSDADLSIASRLVDCGKLLGICVLDFIVIGADDFWSYAEDKE